MHEAILEAYGLKAGHYRPEPLGSGLIHRTWVLMNGFNEPAFVLQQLNTQVFRNPGDIAQNLQVLERFRQHHHPDYLLPVPLTTRTGEAMAAVDGHYFRLTSFVQGAKAYDRCADAEQAYQAAKQFGQFTAVFDGINMDMLRLTLPGFHDLSFRWTQFGEALLSGDRERISQADNLVGKARYYERIVAQYQQLRRDAAFRRRVTHHDTKISNVLFNERGEGICVIDLDTVMPGYFISDVGDMMRTYLSPANEEEQDLTRIGVRPEIYKAIREGYLELLGNQLTETERSQFFYAGEFMIYMQALRFLTDFILDDVYYGRAYDTHNLVRASNQFALLEAYQSLR
jgi:aminoglycoside phosphotransferase (APT) family kinase protein